MLAIGTCKDLALSVPDHASPHLPEIAVQGSVDTPAAALAVAKSASGSSMSVNTPDRTNRRVRGLYLTAFGATHGPGSAACGSRAWLYRCSLPNCQQSRRKDRNIPIAHTVIDAE